MTIYLVYIRIYMYINMHALLCMYAMHISTKVVVIILYIRRPNRASPAALPIYYRCRSRLAVAINQRSVGRFLLEKKNHHTTRGAQDQCRRNCCAVSRKYIILLYIIFFLPNRRHRLDCIYII